MPRDLVEARAMEPARLGGFGCCCCWVGGGCGVVVLSLLVEDELDLIVVGFDDGWRLCGLLVLVLVSVLLLLLLGALLRLRPRRYSSAGLRKMPDPAPSMSVVVPSREDAVPVTGSHRRFSIKIGLER